VQALLVEAMPSFQDLGKVLPIAIGLQMTSGLSGCEERRVQVQNGSRLPNIA